MSTLLIIGASETESGKGALLLHLSPALPILLSVIGIITLLVYFIKRFFIKK
jgi:hypothetical protein